VSEQSKSYSLLDEDHTLGNALRHVMMQDPNTEFCGYTIPHPSEPILHIRLQTNDTTTSDKTLVAGAKTLKNMCDHILTEYNRAVKDF
jgi:DNA-directed RNA polymerase I and III subunit RPAC2